MARRVKPRCNYHRSGLGFDWETTTHPSQRGRFGAYQVYKGTVLHEFGFFYADDIPPADLECLRRVVASMPHARLLTVSQFREWVFWKIGYRRRARIFGFNLPFDISRTATGNSPARGETMRGGFSFSLSEGTWWPRVQIKHLSRKAALIQFAPRRRDSSSREKRGLKTPHSPRVLYRREDTRRGNPE